MLSAFLSGMHRHTRLSRYVDKKKMKRTIQATRPGSQGFSFTGEFPEMEGWKPVEATSHRRDYTRPDVEKSTYRAVGNEDAGRLPVVNRYGVRFGAAMVYFAVLAVLLAGVSLWAYAGNAGVSKRLAMQESRIVELENTASSTWSEITRRSSGVNIRQEASRIGLKSSRGMDVTYLEVPEDATIGPGTVSTTQDMAYVWAP